MKLAKVLPMYMGVILNLLVIIISLTGAPHVYGGDPKGDKGDSAITVCSPCIWG